MEKKRTDLALEAKELWQEQAGETTKLRGIRAREQMSRGIRTTVVEVLNEQGAQQLEKPIGTYVTLELDQSQLREPAGFSRAAARLGKEVNRLLPGQGAVLVAGLGNAAVTPDAMGPKTLEHLVITRHLGDLVPNLRPVSAVAPGVLGTTGLESVEIIRGVVERAKPCCVIVVDALASCRLERLFATIQLTDTGITPGSGVGNRRAAFNETTLGVPVVAVGVPTVVEFQTALQDYIRTNSGKIQEKQSEFDRNLVITPKDVDARTERMARLLGYGISIGLHRNLTVEDVSCFVG